MKDGTYRLQVFEILPASHLATAPLQVEYPHTSVKYIAILSNDPSGVRTNCAEREERIESRWEKAKWLTLPGRNVLAEVYRTATDPGKHKETAHYAKWRDTVAEMMAEPRSSVKYDNIYPDDEGWG